MKRRTRGQVPFHRPHPRTIESVAYGAGGVPDPDQNPGFFARLPTLSRKTAWHKALAAYAATLDPTMLDTPARDARYRALNGRPLTGQDVAALERQRRRPSPSDSESAAPPASPPPSRASSSAMPPGKYRHLAEWLLAQPGPVVETSFDQVARLVGGLPPSSLDRQWWANSDYAQAKGWLAAGYVVDTVDLSGRTVRFVAGERTRRPRSAGAPRARRLVLDGAGLLEDTLRRAGWPTVEAAVAAHTVFLPPATVAQAGRPALFPVVRDPTRRSEISTLPDGRPVLFDDNTTPTDAFLWAANRRKGPDVQFNHVWPRPGEPGVYTALWNVCCTPAFLAKTTDTHDTVKAALRFRAWELYGFLPDAEPTPTPPPGYSELRWHPMPEPLDDLEAVLRTRLRGAPAHRACIAARQIGWRFSAGPDPRL
jgi:hypothetical protein